jgi:hypothetical protein
VLDHVSGVSLRFTPGFTLTAALQAGGPAVPEELIEAGKLTPTSIGRTR